VTAAVLLLAEGASAEKPNAAPVRKASFDAAVASDLPQSITFIKKASQAGDRVEQSQAVEMRMTTTVRQGVTLVEQTRGNVCYAQRRVVTTTSVDHGRVTEVKVQYIDATKQVSESAAGANSKPLSEGTKSPEPVAGKTYVCRREPGAAGKLKVTYLDGKVPPEEECNIVSQHMESIGRPNPLAEYLDGRQIAIGETIQLPQQIARRIFSLGEAFGEVTQFDLTLQTVEHSGSHAQATFNARVEAASNNASQMRMQVEGPIVVQVDTCRALKVDLSGPIGLSETRGSVGNSYQVIGTGNLKTHIASTYHDAKR
jgi:hypothetical protein